MAHSSDTERAIRHAKRAVRSELSVSRGEWRRDGYASGAAARQLLDVSHVADDLERVDGRTLSVEEFVRRYERPGIPVVVTGLCDDWSALPRWTTAHLLRSYGQHRFKVGSDDDGYAVRLRLCDFLYYCASPRHGCVDDSPLYIFDGSFADRRTSRALAADYSVPELFGEDLLRHAGARRRPPYRWLVAGPPRSGSGVHVDPLATSAWNALLRGRKRWALLPPGTPRSIARPDGEPGREAATWFARVWPRLHGAAGAVRMLNAVQRAGETVFVPGGWWHAVLNLEDTLAVTQNFVSTTNFRAVWRHAHRGRPKMSVRWRAALRTVRPDLASITDELEAAGDDVATSASSSSSSSSSSSGDSDSSSGDSSDGGGCRVKENVEGDGRHVQQRRRIDGRDAVGERDGHVESNLHACTGDA